MRRAAKVDRNQAEIVAALRDAGRSVLILSRVGQGCPDLLVGWGGRNLLMEVKAPGGTLTPDQLRFAGAWRGSFAVVRTVGEALAATGVVIERAA